MKRMVAAVSLVASLIGIFTFLTGRMSLDETLRSLSDPPERAVAPRITSANAVRSIPSQSANVAALPKTPTQYVTDLVGVLAPTERDQLTMKLKRIDTRELAQAIVYIADRVPADMVLEDFTLRAVNAWGVGRSGVNDGLVIFVFVSERTVRIEVGLGLESVVSDEVAADIIKNDLAPFFQRQHFAQGLAQALDKLEVLLVANRTRDRPTAVHN